jgi:pimeloyl-ACP methyl ester carboxylesterase
MADVVPVTEEKLRAAMRDPRYWRFGHPEREAYNNWVTEAWQAFGRAGEGKNGVVHVRAYTRTRNGKTERVGDHTRADPPGGEETGGSEGKPPRDARALLVQTSDSATPPSPRPGITANSPTLVIFVGGGGDSKTSIVEGFAKSDGIKAELGNRRIEYFTHDQAAAIMAMIAAQPRGTRIVLVGHSWGGDTVAQITAALGRQGRPVDTLITVDPVGRGLSDEFFRRVRAGSREWVNIRAGGAGSPSDVIAAVGGTYGEGPRRHATQFIDAPLGHGNFNDLLRHADPSGVSGFSRVLGR